MIKRKGVFITFEGGEGCGKSTHSRLLKRYLERKGFKVILTKEPGGTRFGEKIRDILLKKKFYLDKITELFLFTADRSEHVSSKIIKALDKGFIVICDRYIDSTTAYQHGGRSISKVIVDFVNKISSHGVVPDLTFFLDVPVEVGLKRAKGKIRDRFESESLSFHRKVRDMFLALARKNKKRIKIIDSTKDIKSVQEEIRQVVNRYLGV